VKNNH